MAVLSIDILHSCSVFQGTLQPRVPGPCRTQIRVLDPRITCDLLTRGISVPEAVICYKLLHDSVRPVNFQLTHALTPLLLLAFSSSYPSSRRALFSSDNVDYPSWPVFPCECGFAVSAFPEGDAERHVCFWSCQHSSISVSLVPASESS